MSNYVGILIHCILFVLSPARKVYSFDEAFKVLSKGVTIRTIQSYGKCEFDGFTLKSRAPALNQLGGIQLKYLYTESDAIMNFYDTELVFDPYLQTTGNQVLYNAVNATVYRNGLYNNGDDNDSVIHLRATYLNAQDYKIEDAGDIYCWMKNDSFYFTVPELEVLEDGGIVSVNYHYALHSFVEVYTAISLGANMRMVMDLSSTQCDISTSGVVNVNDNKNIFDIFINGIHSEEITTWEGTTDLFIAWASGLFIFDPITANTYHLLSTSVASVTSRVGGNTPIFQSTNLNSNDVVGWINISCPFNNPNDNTQHIVTFYSDIKL